MKKDRMMRQIQTRIRREEEVLHMTVTVHIYPDEQLFLEVPDGTEDPLTGDNQRLSHQEFKAALEEWDAFVKKIAKPDAEPLSDYAMSRESIYENHPKL